MKNFRIVRAVREQVIEVAKVFKTSRTQALPYLPELHTPEEDKQYFSAEVFEKDQVYVAECVNSRRILGFIAFNDEFVDHLYLLPDSQRMGIGTALINIAKERSSSLKLWTFQKNLNAQKFYLKHGFSVVKETDGQENEEQEPDVLLGWNQK